MNPDYEEKKEIIIPEEILLRYRGYKELILDRRIDPWSETERRDSRNKIYLGFFCDIFKEHFKLDVVHYNFEGGLLSEADKCNIQHLVDKKYQEVKIARLDEIRYFIYGLPENADLDSFAKLAPKLLDEYFERIKPQSKNL